MMHHTEARSLTVRAFAAPSDAAAAAHACNAFGADLYRALTAERPEGNLVFSPASIAIALTMAAAGARGDTRAEMLSALQVGAPATIHRSLNALTSALELRNGADVTLSIVDSLWGQLGFGFDRAFLELLAVEYGAGVQLVDFGRAEDVRQTINRWVNERTRGRIPELVPTGMIAADARLAVVDAIYMKARWSRPFEVEATRDIAFTTDDGSTKDVAAMFMARTLRYASGAGWQAVELPYVGEQLAMTILVPDAGALSSMSTSLPLAHAIDSLEYRAIRLALPRFDIESCLSVGDALQVLGMRLAFTDDADFTGITTDEPLDIAAVIHRANITVDEHGTEAAAATAVFAEGTGAPVEPLELTIDRPFLFAVRDRETATVLFLGRVGDPSG